MAIQKKRFEIPGPSDGLRLDAALAQNLTISKGHARKLIVAGAVYLNGRRVRIASKPLLPGAVVEVFHDPSRTEAPSDTMTRKFQSWSPKILYEDDDLIAIDKPAGLPTQPTVDEARANVFSLLKKFLSTRIPDLYLGLHHRLDRDTSGVLLFTKSKRANAPVAEAFRTHTALKTYRATVRLSDPAAKPEWVPGYECWVKNFLAKAPEKRHKMAYFHSVPRGGDVAETEFKVLSRSGADLTVEAKPKTGRTHQIRVHLAELGLPILGDRLYGGSPAERMQLHALRLEIPHPVTGKRLVLEAKD